MVNTLKRTPTNYKINNIYIYKNYHLQYIFKTMLSRRQMLKSSLGIIALSYTNIFNSYGSIYVSNRFNIGACDWSIGQHSNIEAMEVAKNIGLDGVQISLGNLENNMHLRQK